LCKVWETAAEPVKNQEFVELLYADSKTSNDDENENEELR
jgi:hypothetical protein